jgi:transcriptional regulator with XRE-family HTH domain
MNWSNVISNLQHTGLTQAQIAQRGGMSQPAVSALATGRNSAPSYANGEALLRLHKEVCGEAAHLRLLCEAAEQSIQQLSLGRRSHEPTNQSARP